MTSHNWKEKRILEADYVLPFGVRKEGLVAME